MTPPPERPPLGWVCAVTAGAAGGWAAVDSMPFWTLVVLLIGHVLFVIGSLLLYMAQYARWLKTLTPEQVEQLKKARTNGQANRASQGA